MSHRLMCAVLILFLAGNSPAQDAAKAVPSAAVNDNRHAAGALEGGVLTLNLEIQDATWFPEKEPGPSMHAYAFAEHGKVPQIPGPLLRVPQGTKIHARIHNTLPTPMFLRGLSPHDAANPEPVRVAAGETAGLDFNASTVGTYYYMARSMKESVAEVGALPITDDLTMGENPFAIESQLVGGFIVDPPGATPDDRIFIITIYTKGVISGPFREVATINGKAWPYTERLSQRVGDRVNWRVVNASLSDHALHLHGFFFQLNSLGDSEHDHIYTQDEAPHEVTQHLDSGATMSLTWAADRPGQWLFHCHMTGHMSPDLNLEAHPWDKPMDHTSHAEIPDSAGMAGLILGVKVAPSGNEPPVARTSVPARHLRLLVRERPASRYSALGMGYQIQEPNAKATDDPPPVPGPPLVLTRGEPTEIEVVNQLHEVTAVHWHGIELESYYDGVPGWSGGAQQMTPPIAPGGTFVARMTPPRAGTFIYHTHWHDVGQLTGGLYGPLVVTEPGEKFNPDVDKIFIIGRSGPDESVFPIVLNGTPQPSPLVLKAGTRYHFRFINIAPNDSDAVVSLMADSKPVQWLAVAKDGWTLTGAQRSMRPAQQLMTVGETYDFEFAPSNPGKLELEVVGRFLEIKLSQLIVVH